jgi:hypothetical protein
MPRVAASGLAKEVVFPPFGPVPERRSGAMAMKPRAANSSATVRTQSVRPLFSWMTMTAVALSFTSGKTTKQSTSREPFLTFVHSWWRGDLSSLAFAQS